MGLDLINKHVAKILLALEEGDSVNGISQKTGSSYGWTHEWIEKLEKINVLERDNSVHVKDEEFRESFESTAKTVLAKDLGLEDAYLLPNFSGLKYRYCKTDSIYIWTEGAYQIARNKEDYPIFIEILQEQLNQWKDFLDSFSVDYSLEEKLESSGNGIYFVLYPRVDFSVEWKDNASVPSLEETVEYAERYKVNFQPALEILDEMYDLDLDVDYRERKSL